MTAKALTYAIKRSITYINQNLNENNNSDTKSKDKDKGNNGENNNKESVTEKDETVETGGRV